MGGKSKSSSKQTTSNAQYSQVNDGDFAGASDFVVDESDNSIEDSYNQSYEQTIEDSYNQTYEYNDESDNSFTYTDESDNSLNVEDSFNTTNNYEDNSDNSQNYTDESETNIDRSQTYVDESDNSQYFEDNSDNSYTDESVTNVDKSQSFVDSSDNSQTYTDSRQIDRSQTYVDESDNSQYFEDNSDRSVDNSQYFEDNSDNSQTYVDESVTDNSQYFEDNSDRSVDNSQYFEDNSDNSQTYVDESDNSQYFEDNRDLSVSNSGEFAGVGGDVTILDGGAIGDAFEYAKQVNAEGNATAKNAIDAVTAGAVETVYSAERTANNSMTAMFDSLKESLGFGRDSISAIQQQSAVYADELSANVAEFSDTLETITTSAISNANSQVVAANQSNSIQLQTVADLAESTATGGASSAVDASVSQVKYIAAAVALGMAALAFGGK